jgi:HAD superfamily hydrolase (TIGR01490 family)
MNNTRIAAIFDVDGTLVKDGSLERIFIKFLWRRGQVGWREVGRAALGALGAFISGRSPIRANKAYLRGKDAIHIRRLARQCFEQEIRPRLSPDAIERLHWHQSAGHFVILLSGTLDLLLEPLAEFLGVSARVGTELEIRERYFTGRITGLHPYKEAKAECLRVLNCVGLFNLKRSFAYADTYADRHLLESVGNPVATNPDPRLRCLAERGGWMIENFHGWNGQLFMERGL